MVLPYKEVLFLIMCEIRIANWMPWTDLLLRMRYLMFSKLKEIDLPHRKIETNVAGEWKTANASSKEVWMNRRN